MNEVKEVTFDVGRTLRLISQEDDLLEVLNKKYSVDELSIACAESGLIKPSAEKYVKGIFEKLILKRKEFVDSYIGLSKINAVVEAEKANETKLPRRYGKVEIQKDIEKQGGKATEVQRMLIKNNDLKNMVAKLNRLGIADMVGGADNLTDKQCREIIATVQLMENKLKKILK